MLLPVRADEVLAVLDGIPVRTKVIRIVADGLPGVLHVGVRTVFDISNALFIANEILVQVVLFNDGISNCGAKLVPVGIAPKPAGIGRVVNKEVLNQHSGYALESRVPQNAEIVCVPTRRGVAPILTSGRRIAVGGAKGARLYCSPVRRQSKSSLVSRYAICQLKALNMKVFAIGTVVLGKDLKARSGSTRHAGIVDVDTHKQIRAPAGGHIYALFEADILVARPCEVHNHT